MSIEDGYYITSLAQLTPVQERAIEIGLTTRETVHRKSDSEPDEKETEQKYGCAGACLRHGIFLWMKPMKCI